jgi:hypothetical protein
MAKNRRCFTAKQQLAIINEADQCGFTLTHRKHNLADSVFNRCKESFHKVEAASQKIYSRQEDPAADEVQDQIRLLKKVVARLELDLEFKNELLIKASPKVRSLPGDPPV